MKFELGIAGLRAAWAIIATGQRIVRLAERMEAREEKPYTWRCNLAWRLMTLGERVEALGEAVDARVFLWAQQAGCDTDSLLARLVSRHSNAQINSLA